jgi:hypothetical protein
VVNEPHVDKHWYLLGTKYGISKYIYLTFLEMASSGGVWKDSQTCIFVPGLYKPLDESIWHVELRITTMQPVK